MQSKSRVCGRIDLAIFVSRLKWKAGNEGTAHDISFTSDILIITLLSNFLLQYVVSKLGLGLSPSRQTVIRYNDSTVIRCYVRPYSPHYAPWPSKLLPLLFWAGWDPRV